MTVGEKLLIRRLRHWITGEVFKLSNSCVVFLAMILWKSPFNFFFITTCAIPPFPLLPLPF